MIKNILKNHWFSAREVSVYLACLELGNTIASSIARKAGENRVTTYSILKELIKRWVISEINKDWVKYFSAVSPKKILEKEKDKIKKFEDVLPELMAIANTHENKPKVFFYDWFERVKNLFMEIVDAWDDMDEPFLDFVWTQNMDKRFEDFFANEFREYRLKQENPTKAIISEASTKYSKYHQDNHNTLVIDNPIFEMWNEIVLYWNKVAILSYNKDEIYGLVIESKILFKWLTSMFNLIWMTYKK